MSTRILRARTVLTLALVVGFAPIAAASTWFVRADVLPGGDGTSWAGAFDTLSLGIAAASPGDQVWVKLGTYRPGTSTSPRTSTFQLKTGVAIYGGFAGVETLLSQRDFVANPTILSGDLLLDDGPEFANRGDNVYHVVTALNVTPSAVLDGFTIRGGNANGQTSAQYWGAGVFGANASLRNLVIVDNEALAGAGIMLPEGAPTPAPIVRCTLRGNHATAGGGGMYCIQPGFALRECIFGGNSSPVGGGIYIELSSQGPGSLENCIVAGNSATQLGGGIRTNWCMLRVTNSVIAFNDGGAGTGGMYGGGQPFASVTAANSIVWGNTSSGVADPYSKQLSSAVLVDTTAIQDGPAPLNLNPRWTSALGADGVPGTADDDFTLSCVSPYIDRGSNANAAGLTVDLAGHPRFVDDPATPDLGTGTAPIVDLGPYEFTCACNHVTSYCSALPNTSGQPAALSWSGSTSLFANALTFGVTHGPSHKNGLFFYGPLQVSLPFGDGIRCIGGPLFRLPAIALDANGAATFPLDVTVPPMSSGPGQLLEGATWNFQFYFRDPQGGPAGWNASDALTVTFCR